MCAMYKSAMDHGRELSRGRANFRLGSEEVFRIGYQLSDLHHYRATLPANPATACAIVFR